MFKKLLSGVVLLFLVAGGQARGDSDFRVFTDREGRSVSAKIVNVDARRGLVELELENKRRKKIDPSIFSDKDQDYIRDWEIIKTFMTSSAFKLEMNKKVIEDWTEKGTAQRDFEKILYELDLKNSSGLSFENIQLEYNIFYEQEQLTSAGEHTDRHCTMDCINGITLGTRSSKLVRTDAFTIFDQHLSGGYDGYVGGLPERQEGDVKGVWVKVSMSTPSGLTATREFLSPRSLSSHQSWNKPETAEPSGKKDKKKNR